LEMLDLNGQAYDDRGDGEASLFALSKSPDVVRLCEEGIISSEDKLCVQNYEIPGETAFLAAAGAVSGLIGLILIVLLHCNSGITRWDLLHVVFFSSRIFDLMTDWGMFGFTIQQPNWDEVMQGYHTTDDDDRELIDWADPIKYMSLISSIFGTLLFIPDIFVFARKLGLAQKLGGCFNWYNPSRKASAIIMGLTLLLESVPQLICAVFIIIHYGYRGSLRSVIPAIVSAVMTSTTILSDTVFFFKLCCGHTNCCSSCWCACCHCDVSNLFDDKREDDDAKDDGNGTMFNSAFAIPPAVLPPI